MLRIGLTGGIGCGKSTVCRLFADLGVPVIDADLIARQLVEPGRPALTDLSACFGADILQVDGSLNRTELKRLAFSDPQHKQRLDALMHPLVYREIEAQAGQLNTVYCILAIPLLLETRHEHIVDRIVVVDCPPTLQLQRVMIRDAVNAHQAEAIIATQYDRERRLSAADDVIDNSSTADRLAEQVKSLHNLYITVATARITSA